MDASALLLSRLQFAFTISFHIIFPAFSIGLAAWLVGLEAMHLRTGKASLRCSRRRMVGAIVARLVGDRLYFRGPQGVGRAASVLGQFPDCGRIERSVGSWPARR
jgi:hypothetical protein